MNAISLDLTRRNLAGNIATLLSNSALSQGFIALTFLLIARQLGSTSFGQFSACLALASVTSVFFNLGLDVQLLREGARNGAMLPHLIGSALGFKLIAGFCWMGLLVLFSIAAHLASFPPALMALTAAIVWLDSLLRTALTAYKTSLQNKYTLLLESTSSFLWLIGTVLLIYLGSTTPEPFAAIRLVILLATVLIAFWLIYRWIGLHANRQTMQGLLRQTPPYAFSELLSLAAMRFDVVIVAFALGSYYVGIYSPPVSIVNAVFFIPLAIYVVMVPTLSNLFDHNPARAWSGARKFTFLLFLAGLGLSIILWASANLIATFLGESYAGSALILQILSAILLFKSLSTAMAGILIAGGQQAQRATVQAIVVGLAITIDLLIVSRFGIQGVAVVFVLAELLLFLGYLGLVWRLHAQGSPAASI